MERTAHLDGSDDPQALATLYDSVTANPSGAVGERWVDYRQIEKLEAERLKRDTGWNFEGWRHSVTDSELAHIVKRHGTGREERTGHLPVTREDVLLIPEITRDYDTAQRSRTHNGLDAIVFRKRFDGIVIVVEEVRSGRRKLAVKSLRKRVAGAPHAQE